MQYTIRDVSGRTVMDVAKLIALSERPLKRKDIEEGLGISGTYASNGVAVGEQLGLIEKAYDATLRFAGRKEIKRAERQQLSVFFREALQTYPPFLLLMGYLSQGYDVGESSRVVKVVFEIGAKAETVKKALVGWGKYAGLLIEKAGRLRPVVEPLKMLDLGQLRRLVKALDTDLGVKNFVMEELGVDLVGELFDKGLSIVEISDAIIDHQRKPDDVCTPVGKLFESYLSSLQPSSPLSTGNPGPNPVPLSNIVGIADSLLSQKIILRTHKNLSYGVAGFRNASSHGTDPDTGKPWSITSDSALIGILLAIATLRSTHRYRVADEQVI